VIQFAIKLEIRVNKTLSRWAPRFNIKVEKRFALHYGNVFFQALNRNKNFKKNAAVQIRCKIRTPYCKYNSINILSHSIYFDWITISHEAHTFINSRNSAYRFRLRFNCELNTLSYLNHIKIKWKIDLWIELKMF